MESKFRDIKEIVTEKIDNKTKQDVFLQGSDYHKLKQIALNKGTSYAEIIRVLIENFLADTLQKKNSTLSFKPRRQVMKDSILNKERARYTINADVLQMLWMYADEHNTTTTEIIRVLVHKFVVNETSGGENAKV